MDSLVEECRSLNHADFFQHNFFAPILRETVILFGALFAFGRRFLFLVRSGVDCRPDRERKNVVFLFLLLLEVLLLPFQPAMPPLTFKAGEKRAQAKDAGVGLLHVPFKSMRVRSFLLVTPVENIKMVKCGKTQEW